MPARFCVLASGSAGNCALLQSNGFGLLIDIGLGPRLLSARLADVGASWRDVHAVLLTHTHTDHWKDLTLAHLHRLRIPLYCSRHHHASMTRYNGAFEPFVETGLVRELSDGETLALNAGVTVRPIAVPHDCEPTYGFRIDGPPGLFGPQWSLGYAADLGECRPELLAAFSHVNVLALEFNHCEQMERASSRPRFLIQRVLSESGHLSNRQAADAVRAIVRASATSSVRHLIQLHLSRDCNRVSLAAEAARTALVEVGSQAAVITAQQYAASRVVALDGNLRRAPA
jgi:phosphoribosyl 1,2-cyclic phosphodiesterase